MRPRKNLRRRAQSLKKRYGVGDQVKVNFGGRKTPATVVEDRGNLDANDGQLLRVKVATENGEREFEVPAAAVTKAGKREAQSRP